MSSKSSIRLVAITFAISLCCSVAHAAVDDEISPIRILPSVTLYELGYKSPVYQELPPVTVTGKRDRTIVCVGGDCQALFDNMRMQAEAALAEYLAGRFNMPLNEAKTLAELVKMSGCTVAARISPQAYNTTKDTDPLLRAAAASEIIQATMGVRTWNGTVWQYVKGFFGFGEKVQTFTVMFTDGTKEDYQWHAMASSGTVAVKQGSLVPGSGVAGSACR